MVVQRRRRVVAVLQHRCAHHIQVRAGHRASNRRRLLLIASIASCVRFPQFIKRGKAYIGIRCISSGRLLLTPDVLGESSFVIIAPRLVQCLTGALLSDAHLAWRSCY